MEDNPYDHALMSRGKEQTSPRRILLSFDIEEFDVPREHGVGEWYLNKAPRVDE